MGTQTGPSSAADLTRLDRWYRHLQQNASTQPIITLRAYSASCSAAAVAEVEFRRAQVELCGGIRGNAQEEDRGLSWTGRGPEGDAREVCFLPCGRGSARSDPAGFRGRSRGDPAGFRNAEIYS